LVVCVYELDEVGRPNLGIRRFRRPSAANFVEVVVAMISFDDVLA
jgi:hypothetical protein